MIYRSRQFLTLETEVGEEVFLALCEILYECVRVSALSTVAFFLLIRRSQFEGILHVAMQQGHERTIQYLLRAMTVLLSLSQPPLSLSLSLSF